MNGNDFLDIHKKQMDVLGFWDEQYTASIKKMIESTYKPEIIREWAISDIILNGDKTIVKWYKRLYPLSDDDLKSKYGYDL